MTTGNSVLLETKKLRSVLEHGAVNSQICSNFILQRTVHTAKLSQDCLSPEILNEYTDGSLQVIFYAVKESNAITKYY